MSLFSIQITLLTVSVMASHVDWCGKEGSEEMIVCPADVSGEETDQCLDKDQPCGTYCHSWNRAKVYCGESDSCVEEFSTEHIECRNKVTRKCFL